MYIFPDMIDMGLKDGQKWPSEEHKTVAQALLLCNSQVFERDILTEGVQWVMRFSEEKLKTLTMQDVIADDTRPFSIPV
jgi:hypothetical protein